MRLNHVTLYVSDLPRSVEFYRRLGLKQIVGGTEHYARFELPEGGSTLSLHTGLSSQPGSVSVHLESDRLDELVAELREKGFEFEQEPTDRDYLWREAILHDPDGHVLFLYHAGENRLDPPWKLTP